MEETVSDEEGNEYKILFRVEKPTGEELFVLHCGCIIEYAQGDYPITFIPNQECKIHSINKN